MSFSDSPNSSLPLKRMLPEGCDAVGYGNSFRIDKRADGFAGAGFADQRHALAALDLVGDMIDRDRLAARLVERHRQIADIEQGLVDGVHAGLT